MLVSEVMQKELKVVQSNKSVAEVASLMASSGRGCLVVVTEEGKGIGIITERDIVRKIVADKINPSTVLALDIMSTPLVTIEPNATLVEAAKKMTEYGIRRLPVMDGVRLVGIITTTDLARELARDNNYNDPIANAISRISSRHGPYA